nr:hypothetical protein [Tanacetum cinerariifolium]
MSLLFADTHNVVAILEKSDAAEGFKQIINFLSGSYIHYALTVNPHIYISCIKQFWNSVSVKRSGDVTRLQALVDKKKIVISEAVIHEILQLNDAEGVVCLPNEEIFTGLAQMGYEKPSIKLTTSWNEFSTTMASAVICLSKGQRFISLRVKTPLFEGMIADSQPTDEELGAKQVQVDAAAPAAVVETVAEDASHDVVPSSLPHDIPYPSQEPSSPPQQQQRSPQAPPHDAEFLTQLQQVLNVCSALSKCVKNLETDNAAQKLVIIKLKARVKKLEKANKIKSSKLRRLRNVGTSRRVESSDDLEDVFNQERMFDDMDMNEGIELVKDAEVAESEGRHAIAKQEDDSEVQEVVEVVTTAKLITEVTDATSQVSAVSTTIPAVSATVPAAKPSIPAAYTRRRKGVIIRDPEEELSLKTFAETPAETPKVKDKGKGIMIEAPKPMKKKD